jgi:starch synthase
MDILHIASELAPHAKVGGLADVTAALTKHLRLLGHKVTLAVPRYASLEAGGLLLARKLTPLVFELDGKRREAIVYDGRLASGVDLVAIDLPGLFDRAGIYGEDGLDYPDNAARFAAFSRAAVELARQRKAAGTPFQVLHAHDRPTALVPYFARKIGGLPPTVLTIHNLAHQGIVPKEQLPELGIAWEDFTMEGAEFYGQANILKTGLLSATQVTTVSETYAQEIVTPEYGAKLDGVLRHRQGSLRGIVNGVDAAVWNPATDVALPARYDVEDMTNKSRCKGSLLSELGLDLTRQRPLLIFVGRLVHQKGVDVLVSALPKILAADFAVAIAGDGDEKAKAAFRKLAKSHEGQLAFLPAASEAIVHRMFAAADFAVVPSRFEPCGLVQMYAQRYGALPIAHATGGLRDTIVDCDAALDTGTGFLFDDVTSASLLGAVGRARAAYDSARFRALVRRVMRVDVGWERPARQIEQLYKTLASAG